MINNIENLSERMKIVSIVRRRRQFCHLIVERRFRIYIDRRDAIYSRLRVEQMTNTNDVKIYRSTKIHNLYKSYDCACNEFRIYRLYECRMQQISHEANYKSETTLEQTVEYIVLLFVSLIRLQ